MAFFQEISRARNEVSFLDYAADRLCYYFSMWIMVSEIPNDTSSERKDITRMSLGRSNSVITW